MQPAEPSLLFVISLPSKQPYIICGSTGKICGSTGKECAMIIFIPRSLAFALLIAALPVGSALAGGAGGGGGRGGASGGGVGAAGMGSAAVGGGAPAGAVGGGPSAGEVGGGSPGSSNPAGNGAAGTGIPSRNAGSVQGNGTNASPGIANPTTTGGVIGGSGGIPPMTELPGGTSPDALSRQSQSDNPTAPKGVKGIAEQTPFSPTGLARPGPDGVSTVTVAARPCGVAARETDGTTTCIGIPEERAGAKKRR
jgi:hypothetical protein